MPTCGYAQVQPDGMKQKAAKSAMRYDNVSRRMVNVCIPPPDMFSVVEDSFGISPINGMAVATDAAGNLYTVRNDQVFRNGTPFLNVGGDSGGVGSSVSFIVVRGGYLYARYNFGYIRKYLIETQELVCTYTFALVGNCKHAAFDSRGNLIVAVWNNFTDVRGRSGVAYVSAAQDAMNQNLTIADSPWTPLFESRTGTDGCSAIAVDASDNIYVACLVTNRILKLSSVGSLTASVTDFITTGVDGARGLVFDSMQNLYVSGQDKPYSGGVPYTAVLTKIPTRSKPQRLPIRTLPGSNQSSIWSLTFDTQGRMYYVDISTTSVYRST